MEVSWSITVIWTFAVVMSGGLSILLIDMTLIRRYSTLITGGIWMGILGWAYLISLLFYSHHIANDFFGIIGTSLLVWLGSVLLYKSSVTSRLFIGVTATLIANVGTFFLCGTTLSFINHDANPYNIRTISIFIGIKLFWFALLYLLYRIMLRKIIMAVIEIMDGKMHQYLMVSLVSFAGFYGINRITNDLGIFPGAPSMRYTFIVLYLIICLIFICEYWQIFTSVFWSSRALKTEAELDVASMIQNDMLPCIFPAFPGRDEFDIYATMEPAKEVGGDFYDFFLVDSGHLGIVIADVSGKGVPAALFMVITKTLIKNRAQSGEAPEEVFANVNNQLCENNQAGMFVTAWLGILEIRTGIIKFVNAGHNPPIKIGRDGTSHFIPCKPGFVLAAMEDIAYREQEIRIEQGDVLFLYTDGVTESTNSYNQLFGDERLIETLNRAGGRSATELLPFVKSSVDQFVDGADQFDDITMLTLHYL